MSIVPRQIGRYYAFNVPLLAQGMGRWALWNCENLPTSPVVYLVDHEGNYIVDHLGNYIVTDDGEAWSIETSPASSWLCESLPESQILYLTDHLGNYIVDHEGNYIVSYVGVSTRNHANGGLVLRKRHKFFVGGSVLFGDNLV